MGTILIIEDEKLARTALARALEKKNYNVLQAESGEKGIRLLKSEEIHLVLCDIKLPGMDGLEVLEQIKEHSPRTVVIMMTAFGSIEKAVRAIKLGARDFLEKPLDLETVRLLVDNVIKTKEPAIEREFLIKQAKEMNFFEGMIGSGKAMHEVFETIIKVAPSRATVLITGETGVGKELAAKAIHRQSRREGPFVAVNLRAITDTLFESELFGYVKGAHSTAFKDRKGKLAEADKGSFFIDEVGDMPDQAQVKLLRVLETRSFERVGENITQKFDSRFITATNKDLEKAIVNGDFREDLYYRLRVVEIHIPPLREHPEDIPLLVQGFITKYSDENDRPVRYISQDAMDLLRSHNWPGNIRELEREIESAVVIAEGDTLKPEHFSHKIQNTEIKSDMIFLPIGTSMRDAEKELIIRTLDYTEGNKTKAAEILGIGTRTLYRKIDEYGL